MQGEELLGEPSFQRAATGGLIRVFLATQFTTESVRTALLVALQNGPEEVTSRGYEMTITQEGQEIVWHAVPAPKKQQPKLGSLTFRCTLTGRLTRWELGSSNSEDPCGVIAHCPREGRTVHTNFAEAWLWVQAVFAGYTGKRHIPVTTSQRAIIRPGR